MLPMNLQRVLRHGSHRAKCYKQAIHWDTTEDLTIDSASRVYTELYGKERASMILAAMSRAKKESEAKARLEAAE